MPSSLNPEPGFLNTSEPLADIITPDPPPLLSADSSDTIMPSPIDKPLPAAPLAPLNDSFIVSTSSSPSNSRATRSTRIPRSTRPARDHQRQTQERAQPIAINGTTADETGRDVPYMILAWRIWLCLEITLLILMLSLSIYALLKDREPCDSGVWVFALSSASVMLAQILLATGLLINLPNPKLGSTMRMTWEVYRRFVLSRCTFFMSFIISMVQIALIPAGIAIVKTADQKCFTTPTLTYTYTFYISLAQCIILVCISIPICFMPCCFLLFDLPTYHGVSPQAIRRLTTITYLDPISTETLTETALSLPSKDTELPLPAVTSTPPSRINWSPFFPKNQTAAAAAESPHSKNCKRGNPSRHETVRETECAICLEPWKNGEIIKRMRCGHSYHEDCLVAWLEEHDHCPYCRDRIKNRTLF